MAYVKRPVTQGNEFFRSDVFVTYRSADSLNEETDEIKKGWVFILSRKNPDTGKYDLREERKVLDFTSLINLDKLEWEHEKSDLVRNAYSDILTLRDKKTNAIKVEVKWNNDLRKFVDVKTWLEYNVFQWKVKKVLIWQLVDTKEIFTLDLGWTIARALMSKNFSKANLYNPSRDYKQTEEEKRTQAETVNLFFDGTTLKLEPEATKVKVGKDTQFKNILLLKLSGDTSEPELDEACWKAIELIENQLDNKSNTKTITPDNSNDEISIEDISF